MPPTPHPRIHVATRFLLLTLLGTLGHSQLAPVKAQLPGKINLSTVGGSTAGAVFQGANANDLAGVSVSAAGDFNGDGIDDLLIGALGPEDDGNGLSYLVYGREGEDAYSGAFSLADVPSTVPGVVFQGVNDAGLSGNPVRAAGDVNGDGIHDILIGAEFSADEAGQSYLVYGQEGANALSGFVPLSSVGIGTAGATFTGANAGDGAFVVSTAGDVNGDGVSDLVVGALYADGGAGRSYLVYGSFEQPLSGNINLGDVGTSVEGAVFRGVSPGDLTGIIAGAGDVNGDGFGDLLIGAEGSSPGGRAGAGTAYLVYGGDSDAAPHGEMFVSEIGNSIPGAAFLGINPGDEAGRRVSVAGDVNGDGRDDLLIAARRADPGGVQDAGESYLIYGKTGANMLQGPIELSSVGETTDGAVFEGVGTGDLSLSAFSTPAGDINGDGLFDLVISARFADVGGNEDVGEVYLILGSEGTTNLTGRIPLSEVGTSVAGTTFRGINALDEAGASISLGGDINNDGIDDILLGAFGPGDDAGAAYLIYGVGAFSIQGDFDGNGTLDPVDIDMLSSHILSGGMDLSFDLNGDDVVDGEDRRTWVFDLADTLPGDADLNLAVEFTDFVALAEHFGGPGGWADGDFTGDLNVQFGDFVLLANNFGKSASMAAVQVPEPGSPLVLAAISFTLLTGRRRRIAQKKYPPTAR